MAADEGHRKRSFLGALAGALGGFLHKRSPIKHTFPETLAEGDRDLQTESLTAESVIGDPACEASKAAGSQGSMAMPPVEEASRQVCNDGSTPEELDCPDEKPGVQDERRQESEPHAVSLETEASRDEQHTDTQDVASQAAKPRKHLVDVDMLSLADLGIASFTRSSFERFGIYMVSDLLLYRREELIELRGVTQRTLSMIELRVTSRTGQPFHLQGSLKSGTRPRRMTHREMIALDANLLELGLSRLVVRQLRRNNIFGCRQIAFTSRDELLDCPGIDLETTYELEEALGALLGVRVVLGCDRGDPPTVVDSEPPYDWRLEKGKSEELFPEDDAEERWEDKPSDISPGEQTVEHYDDNGDREPGSPELDTRARVDTDTNPPDITRSSQLQEPSPVAMVDSVEDLKPEVAEDHSTTAGEQSGNDIDDDDWNDVFGWDDTESEWDDAAKWDWTYGDATKLRTVEDEQGLPDNQAIIGIAEWASSQDDVSSRLLLCLLDGMTKSQAAAECKVPVATVDSLTSYVLNHRPLVCEDEYAHVFENYAMDLEGFIDIFGQPARTFRYLSLTCKPGTKSVSEMLGDDRVPDSAKENLKLRLGRINHTSLGSIDVRPVVSGANATMDSKRLPASVLDEDGLRRLRVSIETRAESCSEYSADFFYDSLSTLMSELGIETSTSLFQLMQEAFKDSREVTFHENCIVRFGKADHNKQILALIEEMSPSTFDDLAQQYKAKYGVGRPLFRVWLHKFYRYQRNGTYDISYVRPPKPTRMPAQQLKAMTPIYAVPAGNRETFETPVKVPEDDLSDGFAEKHIILPQGMRNDLRELAAAILSVAEMNTEYSTNYFYNAFPDLRRGLKAGSKRRFNELVKQAFIGCRGVSFPSTGYFVRFGKCDRDRQIMSLMIEMSPVAANDLCKEYERRYGVGQATLYGWLYCIREYRKDNTYAVEYGPAIIDSMPTETDSVEEAVEAPLTNTADTATPIKPEPEEAMEPGQPSQAQQELRESELAQDRGAVLRSIRETIGGAALSNTEYSTDYFYEALPEMVASVRAGSKMDFYHLVEEAYRGIDGVRFPMGHVIVFGDGNRDRQMLALLKELSPSRPMDLAIAYEKRYGFSRYLVQRWYRKYSDYLENGYYTYRETGASDVVSEASPIADAELDAAAPSPVIEREEPRTAEESSRPMGAGETSASSVTTENARRLPHTQSAPKPKTAVEWALSLEGIERQVVQQTLFGNPLYIVATNASFSLKETSELLISTIGKCPPVREDSFLINFRLSKSRWEFCNSTGEPEYTYYFLSWRSKAQDQGAISDSEIGESGNQVQSSTAEQRRQMRRAVRAEGKIRQFGHVEDGSQVSRSQGERHGRPTTGYQAPGQSRLVIERRVVSEVDRIATMGREYAPAHFYRALLSTMRALGIHSDDELLDIMQHAYRRDPDVSFVEGNVIRFGKCDRRGQLEGFLAENPAATLDSFVAGYERKYGFGKTRVTRWLADCGIDLPKGQPINDLTSNLYQGLLSIDFTDTVARERQIQVEKPPTAKKRLTSSRQRQMELPLSTRRVSRVSRTAEYADFLRGELAADCCDRRLVVERFKARFPDGPDDPFNEQMLWRLGFKAKGKKLLFREGIRYEECFEGLIDSKVMFARGDPGFENAIFNDPQFRKLLRRKMRSFDIVEYEKDSFISTTHLCEQMGISLEDIRGYSQDVVSQLREEIGAPAPFTVWSLRNRYGIRHPLDVLRTEGGMSDFIFETLFDIDPHVQCCTISKKRGFLETDGDFDTGNFIECLIEMNGPMEIDDLIDLLSDAYGIDYPELPLHHTISMSSLYYDDITDSVFNSRHEWEEMVNRELA